jgi:hypothetical protein
METTSEMATQFNKAIEVIPLGEAQKKQYELWKFGKAGENAIPDLTKEQLSALPKQIDSLPLPYETKVFLLNGERIRDPKNELVEYQLSDDKKTIDRYSFQSGKKAEDLKISPVMIQDANASFSEGLSMAQNAEPIIVDNNASTLENRQNTVESPNVAFVENVVNEPKLTTKEDALNGLRQFADEHKIPLTKQQADVLAGNIVAGKPIDIPINQNSSFTDVVFENGKLIAGEQQYFVENPYTGHDNAKFFFAESEVDLLRGSNGLQADIFGYKASYFMDEKNIIHESVLSDKDKTNQFLTSISSEGAKQNISFSQKEIDKLQKKGMVMIEREGIRSVFVTNGAQVSMTSQMDAKGNILVSQPPKLNSFYNDDALKKINTYRDSINDLGKVGLRLTPEEQKILAQTGVVEISRENQACGTWTRGFIGVDKHGKATPLSVINDKGNFFAGAGANKIVTTIKQPPVLFNSPSFGLLDVANIKSPKAADIVSKELASKAGGMLAKAHPAVAVAKKAVDAVVKFLKSHALEAEAA